MTNQRIKVKNYLINYKIFFFLVENWLKNIIASCWSSIIIVLDKFSLKNSKKQTLLYKNINSVNSNLNNSIAITTTNLQIEKLFVDGTKATLEVIQILLNLLIKFCNFIFYFIII